MNENFINFHVLISHSPSCLNRDDMNMQKSAIFGGKRRVRVSSQSLKRTMRISDYYRGNFPEKSIRTRNLGLLVEKLSENLNQSGYEIERKWIEKAVEVFGSKFVSNDDDSDDENDEEISHEEPKDKPKKVAVAPWVVS